MAKVYETDDTTTQSGVIIY